MSILSWRRKPLSKEQEQRRRFREFLRRWTSRPHVNRLEDRITPAIDTIFDTTNATYLTSPTVNNVLDNFQSGLTSVESAVAGVQALSGYGGKLDLAIAGLLDRTNATPTNWAPPDLDGLLDVDAALTKAGFTSVDPGTETGNQIGDYFDNNKIDLSDVIHQYLSNAITVGSLTSLSTIATTVGGISKSFQSSGVGFSLTVDVAGLAYTSLGGSDYELIFDDLVIDLRRTDTFDLALGRNADLLELSYGADGPGVVVGVDKPSAHLPDVKLESFLQVRPM